MRCYGSLININLSGREKKYECILVDETLKRNNRTGGQTMLKYIYKVGQKYLDKT